MNINEILKNIPDKRDNKGTTSIQFKKDLIDFFQKNEEKNNTIVELGTHNGYSTMVLSYLFENVITIDINYQNTLLAKSFNQNRDNIIFLTEDAYKYSWWESDEDITAVFVDTVHEYDSVVLDINNCLKIDNKCYIIFDDYGLFPDVKRAIDDSIESGKLKFITHIGEPSGSDCRKGKTLKDWEGIICKKG